MLFELTVLGQQGFEVIDSIAGRGRTSLIAVSFVVAAYAILKTAFTKEFKIIPVLATAFVSGLVIWLVAGGYGVLSDVVDNEAENISEDIRGLD